MLHQFCDFCWKELIEAGLFRKFSIACIDPPEAIVTGCRKEIERLFGFQNFIPL